jgi:ABC-type transport system substrate-binding protein
MNKSIIIFLIVITSCKINGSKPTSGGELKVAWLSGLVGIDPTKDWGCAGAQRLIRLIYSPLYSQENPELGVAHRVTHSDDYTEWEFLLKKDCYFHPDPCFKEGIRVVNGYDVKYTFEKIKNSWPELEPVDNIKEITVPDSFRVRFLLKSPDKDFPNSLNQEMLYIVPFEAVEKYGENFSFRPVGSGPFALESWNEKELVLIKNKRFWARDRWRQKLPYLDKIIIIFFPDINQAIKSLFDGVVDLSPITIDFAEQLFKRDGENVQVKEEFAQRIQVIRSPFPSLTILLFNSKDNPIFKNPMLRRALNYAINREEIKNLLVMPGIKVADGPTLNTLSPLRYEYSPLKAMELIKKTGFGSKMKGLKFQYYPTPFSRTLSQLLQRQLKKVGIETELVCASRVAVLRGNPEWDLGTVSILFHDSTPEVQLAIYSSFEAPWVDFKSEEFDSLWELYKTTHNDSLLLAMDSLVLKDPPFIFLYWSYPLYLADRKFKNIDPLFLLSPYVYRCNE